MRNKLRFVVQVDGIHILLVYRMVLNSWKVHREFRGKSHDECLDQFNDWVDTI